jgi:hypothetical protein
MGAQVHNIDLTGHDVPWEVIGRIDALEELSLWTSGLSGQINGKYLCQLPRLRVLALSQNSLRGMLPQCITELPLEWLWLEDNRIHGPISEYSALGQYLKDVRSLNLQKNRWAPLLRPEKAALEAIAAPLGVRPEHDWDFTWSYDWDWVVDDTDDLQLTAAREESHRYWGAGVPLTGFTISLPFEFPQRGNIAHAAGIGRDADLVVGDGFHYLQNQPNGQKTTSEWTGDIVGNYMGCFLDPGTDPDDPEQSHEVSRSNNNINLKGNWGAGNMPPDEVMAECSNACDGSEYMGLQWAAICICGNTYGRWGEGPSVKCADNGNGNPDNNQGWGTNSIYRLVAWALKEKNSTQAESRNTCWASLPSLIPAAHDICEAPEATTSSQGADYLSERFCPGWGKFISPSACDPTQPDCTGDDASGSAIFDGGGDMYDLGNVLITSLMGDCTSDPHDCPLGSLRYHGDFQSVETGCFGPNGNYHMGKLGSVWVFLTHNTRGVPLEFAVAGNLGSDGSGMVNEYTFESAPYMGFIKRTCNAGDDPSINHLIVVDGVGTRPLHSCDYINHAACDGASSDIDDDIISGIAPGSPILYLLYAAVQGRCIKEDEHRAIFDAAVQCLWANDPFESVRQSRQAGHQPLVDVVVDSRDNIVFGGTASYTGWPHGGYLERVSGPGGFATGLHFSDGKWLKLGETGVTVQGNWTLDCYVQLDREVRRSLDGDGVLLASTDGTALVSAAVDLITRTATATASPASTDAWHRLTVHVSVDKSRENPCEGLVDDVTLFGKPGINCTMVIANGCDYDLHEFLVKMLPDQADDVPVGSLIHLFCPASCCHLKHTDVVHSSYPVLRRDIFVDGVLITSSPDPLLVCETLECEFVWFAVGAHPGGFDPFPFPIHGLRLYNEIIALEDTHDVGTVHTDVFSPLAYHAENSRWVALSRGADAVEITWDTFGWGAAAHQQVQVVLDPTGGIVLRAGVNSSQMWDRAVAAAAAVTDKREVAAWSLASRTADFLNIAYLDSDPCYNLWDGIDCRYQSSSCCLLDIVIYSSSTISIPTSQNCCHLI